MGVLPALLFQQEDKHASKKKYEEQEEDNADNENHGGQPGQSLPTRRTQWPGNKAPALTNRATSERTAAQERLDDKQVKRASKRVRFRLNPS